MRLRSLLLVAFLGPALVATLAAAPAPALAQPTAAEIEASKKAAAESANGAFDAFKNGKYEEAIAGFQKAEKAFHAPKFVLYVARAQVKLGKLVAARGSYESIVKEALPTYAPAEFFTAQADAKKELIALLPRIPTLQIQGKAGVTTVTLDGQPATTGTPLAVDPGEHTLTGNGAGLVEVKKKVTLQEREARTETLEPQGVVVSPPVTSATEPSASASPSSSASARPQGIPPDPDAASYRVPAITYVAYGVGAVGLIAGGVLGGLTLAKRAEVDAIVKTEPFDVTKANDESAAGRGFALGADIGFATALVGAAVGTIAWVVTWRGASSKAAGRRLLVAPRAGGMTVGGSF